MNNLNSLPANIVGSISHTLNLPFSSSTVKNIVLSSLGELIYHEYHGKVLNYVSSFALGQKITTPQQPRDENVFTVALNQHLGLVSTSTQPDATTSHIIEMTILRCEGILGYHALITLTHSAILIMKQTWKPKSPLVVELSQGDPWECTHTLLSQAINGFP